MSEFKLTYSTMYSPPRHLHDNFSSAVERLKSSLGRDHGLFIDGEFVMREKKSLKFDPADQSRLLGHFSLATAADVNEAVAAAHRAAPAWKAKPWQERAALMRKIATVIEGRMYDLAAALSFEVGKNRMEALGEVVEVSGLFNLYAQQMEEAKGYVRDLPEDPLTDYKSINRSVLKPYGVWAVIAPFNFPLALAAGPTAAALVTGNTVVVKGSLDTPFAGILLSECLHEAGVPSGAFNYLLGDGSIGEALVAHDDVSGITFTGSREVGMRILRAQANKPFPRPCIVEMGGKNAVIVTANADLVAAAKGIVRSTVGMSGQKCSATSRVYVDKAVADSFLEKLITEMRTVSVGDPQAEGTWIGPVTTRAALDRYSRFSERMRQRGGNVLLGATVHQLPESKGFFCQPTIAEAPLDHPLWAEEMFCPIVMVGRVDNAEQAMRLANDTEFGLTAGFYGAESELDWFFDNIEAGVTFANRPQGSTTGAWPGYQVFGGWKGSGSTGKGLGSLHYLPQYMREQSQTRVTQVTSPT